MTASQTFNIDGIAPEDVPTAPLGAFEPADWHAVPKGFYALPVHDWTKFGDECSAREDDPEPPLDLLGWRLFARKVPVVIKTGERAGQAIGRDAFITGQRVLARGVEPRIIRYRETEGAPVQYLRYTPSERLKRVIESDKFVAEHTTRREGDTSPACRCPECTGPDGAWIRQHWKPVPDQANAYANEVASALIYSIEKEDDAFRKLYGLLTGRCGRCGRLLTDRESRRLGIGPDCRRPR